MTNDTLDENAEVLTRMIEAGDDLTPRRDIEFAHLFEDQGAATAFCDWARKQNYAATVEKRDDGKTDVIVRRCMVLGLDAITELELDLAVGAWKRGAMPDGWGCFAVTNSAT